MCLGAGLVKCGKRVLEIDADPQCSLTIALGYENPDEIEETLSKAMAKIINDEEIPKGYAIIHHPEGIDFAAADSDLAGLEMQISSVVAKETILKAYVDKVRKDYDYILIDCEPSLQNMMINSLTAADSVLISTAAQLLSVKGLTWLFKTIGLVRRKLNKKLVFEGVLINLFDTRKSVQKDLVNKIEEAYGGKIKVFHTIIPMDVRMEEMPGRGHSIFSTAPKCRAAQAYENLVQEVIDNEE